ncbi:MAG: hypothetical protein JWO32_566 [Bacteroidetes bacterium]|nr:hypothetical protein [Bacteroidota bacterium]
MNDQGLNVHGSIFFLLKKFVDHNFPVNTWEKLNQEAGTADITFELTQSYPISEIGAIIGAASKATGKPANELKEMFGEYLVPDLFAMYASYLNPAWKTFEVIENTELVMHGAVRRLNSTAHPPILNVTKVNDKLLMVDYFSKRKMGSLAVGIIKGIAKYYNESDKIKVQSMSDADAERVQIRVEFK